MEHQVLFSLRILRMGHSAEPNTWRIAPITVFVLLALLTALSSTHAPAQMMEGRRDSMGGNRAMDVGIGLGLAVGGALLQQQRDNQAKGPADTAKNPPKPKQDISQQKKKKDTPPSGKLAAPPPSQAQQSPQPPAKPETPKQADALPNPLLAAPCPDCTDIAARIARLVKQIEADVDKANDIARERDNHLEEFKGYERSLAEVVEPQDKRYYAKMASLTRDWIRTHEDILAQIKSKIEQQRDFLRREQARLKECIDKNCPKVSAAPRPDNPIAKQPPEPVKQAHPPHGQTPPSSTPVTNIGTPPGTPTAQAPPGTPPGLPPTTPGTPPADKPPATVEKPPVNPGIDVIKLLLPADTGGGIAGKERKPISKWFCGPDITESVLALLREIKSDFDTLKRKDPAAAATACSNLTSMTSGAEAWDIAGLDLSTSAQKDHKIHEDGLAYTDELGKIKLYFWFTGISSACAIPRPQCAATVEFMGTCVHPQTLNYIQWGATKKLCDGGRVFNAAAAAYQFAKGKSASVRNEEDAIAGVGADYVEVLGNNPNPDISQIERNWQYKYKANISMSHRSGYDCQLGCQLTDEMKRKIKDQLSGYKWKGMPGHEHLK